MDDTLPEQTQHVQQPAQPEAKKKFDFGKFDLAGLGARLPAVRKPELKLTFRQKILWTGAILLLFYILGSITVWGVDPNAVARFEFLEIVFGSKFGSIITLGIGPIVTASIILQLLVGSKILKWDTKTPEGKSKFMGVQKLLAVLFCVFEAAAYVMSGAVPPSGGGSFLLSVVILQLAAGGILIIFMDEVVSKWGIGSGVSLFIAAGVAKEIVVRTFNPLNAAGGFPTAEEGPVGILPVFLTSLMGGQPTTAIVTLFPLLATVAVFIIALYAQGMRIEIPMAITMPFGKFGARRWPLRFLYTSNIPVILVAAVIANVQVMARQLSSRGMSWLGVYGNDGSPLGGLALFLSPPQSASLMIIAVIAGLLALLVGLAAATTWKRWVMRSMLAGAAVGLITGTLLTAALGQPAVSSLDWSRSLVYMLILIIGSIIFSKFWVQTAGMDARSVSEQFKSSFLSLPGFRRDPRIIESVLDRYIPAITILGGALIGFLAGFADLTNAVGTGTGILLTVMIIYQLYEQMVQQHSDDMPVWLKKFMGVSQ